MQTKNGNNHISNSDMFTLKRKLEISASDIRQMTKPILHLDTVRIVYKIYLNEMIEIYKRISILTLTWIHLIKMKHNKPVFQAAFSKSVLAKASTDL